jgi:hypothetical protein
MQDTNRSWQQSSQQVRELYQRLYAHHRAVQACYGALMAALQTGQEHKALWEEYRKALIKHRLLVDLYRHASQQHNQNLADILNR